MAWPEEARRKLMPVLERRLRTALLEAGFVMKRAAPYDMETGLIITVTCPELDALTLTDAEFAALTASST